MVFSTNVSQKKLISSRFFPLVLCLGLIGCAEEKTEDFEGKPVEVIYNKAMDMVTAKEYKKAAKAFEDVQRQYPFSTWATRSELMSAYAYFEAGEYVDSVGTLENFIKMHPGHKDIAYAHYLLAMCYYVQIAGVNRDQHMTYKAMHAFQDVIKKFPRSSYAKDAKFKLDLAYEHLAGQDMEIGRFYQTYQVPLSALLRFQNVIQKYQTTSHVPEALHRTVEIYVGLGMTKQALATAAVMGYNFPGNPWYQDTYNLLTSKNLLPTIEPKVEPKKVS